MTCCDLGSRQKIPTFFAKTRLVLVSLSSYNNRPKLGMHIYLNKLREWRNW